LQKSKAYTTLILTAFYFVLHYLQAHSVGPEFIRYHGKDLILVPLLILGIKTASAILGIPIQIRIKELIATILVCTFAFEIFFPKLGMAFAFDLVDVSFYFIGGIFYFITFLSKKEKLKYSRYDGT